MRSKRSAALTSIVASGVLRALGATWRMRSHNAEPLHALRAQRKPVLFALWHGELLPLLWQHRNEGISILISEHKDGEIVARIAHSLGCKTVRGSTSRGGGRALIALSRALRDGGDGAITPDGPRGPARVFAPGAAIAAYRSGAFIVPIRMQTASAWRLNNWDRFTIPKPFARVDVYYGTPTQVFAESPRAAAEQSQALEAIMQCVPHES